MIAHFFPVSSSAWQLYVRFVIRFSFFIHYINYSHRIYGHCFMCLISRHFQMFTRKRTINVNWDRRIGYWIKKTIDIYVACLLIAFNSSNWESMGTANCASFEPQQVSIFWTEFRNPWSRYELWAVANFHVMFARFKLNCNQPQVVIRNEAKRANFSFSRFNKSVEYILVVYHCGAHMDLRSAGFICQLIATYYFDLLL